MDVLPDLSTLEKEHMTLESANEELQGVLKTVRRLMTEKANHLNSLKKKKLMTNVQLKRHPMHHPVLKKITERRIELKEVRLAFGTKHVDAHQKAMAMSLSEDKRRLMMYDENKLLRQSIEVATAVEVVVSSFRCDQVLPEAVRAVVSKYEEETELENVAEKLVNALVEQKPLPVARPKPPAVVSVSRSVEIQLDIVPTTQPASLTECPRCQSPFHVSAPTLVASIDKRFCDCCVRFLPEARFLPTDWLDERPLRCLECTCDLDEANREEFHALDKTMYEAKRVQALHTAVRLAWVSSLSSAQSGKEGHHDAVEATKTVGAPQRRSRPSECVQSTASCQPTTTARG